MIDHTIFDHNSSRPVKENFLAFVADYRCYMQYFLTITVAPLGNFFWTTQAWQQHNK